MNKNNFLPNQYQETNKFPINHNYLAHQFSDKEDIWSKVRRVVEDGDFTLGLEVDRLEAEFAELSGARFAVGVGSGTDALFLSLKSLGLGKDDEVITSPFTFYATIGAIVTSGATPVFCDVGLDYNLDPLKISSVISLNSKVIMPIHWSGNPCDMDQINKIAQTNNLQVVIDACHAINALYKGSPIGQFGTTSCFSFHPLKNLNVWGDGGIITTNSEQIAEKLRLIRNHGLIGRDECKEFSYNSRLDTIQAVVARHMMKKISHITNTRINNARYFDHHLSRIAEIFIPDRSQNVRQVFHIYSILCEQRNELKVFLNENGVDAKIHYPVPMHLQPAAKYLGYSKGDFPVAEMISDKTLSLPVHEFIRKEQQDKVISLIEKFYS
jgi:aminotransferase EvaB